MSAVESTGYQLRRLQRAEYEQLVEAGAFEDERVELLEGFLVEMSPQKAAHSSVIQVLAESLYACRTNENKVRVQLPLALASDSEPEPDLCVVPAGDYREQHPQAALLVVEVAQSSLAKDRQKARIYASAAVPEYWIVDVENRRIEVRTQPADGAYLHQETYSGDGVVKCIAVPALEVRVADVFGV